MILELDGVAIGARLKQARSAKGWSQEVLAEKANTTAQNISKYERNLSNIDNIRDLSNILGINLLEAFIDVDAPVGEIGKEILYTLICFKGNCYFDDLVEKYMYGLSEVQITNEIVKLSKIGTVVRELYTDWYGNEKDRLFITAKGLITFKNLNLNAELASSFYELVDEVITYESLIADNICYGDYIKSRKAEILIRNLKPYEIDEEGKKSFCPYRINYIKYLKENFLTSIDPDENIEALDLDIWCPSEGIYHDIIHRMTFAVDNEAIRANYEEWKDYMDKVDDFLEKYDDTFDKIIMQTKRKFDEEFDWVNIEEEKKEDRYLRLLSEKWAKTQNEYGYDFFEMMKIFLDESKLKNMKFTPERQKEIEYLIHHKFNSFDIFNVCDIIPNEYNYNEKKPKDKEGYPTDWFSKKEIEEYIFLNMGPAEDEKEEEIDRVLIEIQALLPEALEYFSFPRIWEENGLADLIRENWSISK